MAYQTVTKHNSFLPKRWLAYHQPLLFGNEPETLEYRHLRQQGYEVEWYVKQLERFQPNDRQAVDFQRTFQTDELLARSDVVVTDKATGSIDIYEIKGSSQIKEEHFDDVAFQRHVAESSGSNVGRCFLITMNADYVRQGAIDPTQLFNITDVTEEIDIRMELTARQARDRIRPLLAAGTIAVVPGFIGKAPDASLTTLGRGGSDLTATLLARSLGAKRVVCWKDVPGILTADPRLVADARLIPQLHHREAAEVAHYGAKVLHPRALIPIAGTRITLIVGPQ